MSIKARPTQRLQLLALNVIVDKVFNRSEMGFESDIASALAALVDKTRSVAVGYSFQPKVKKMLRNLFFASFSVSRGERGETDEEDENPECHLNHHHLAIETYAIVIHD